MKTIFILLIVQNLLFHRETKGLELSSLVDVCDVKDPNLNECVKEATNKFIKIICNGISDWNIQPLDPLTTPSAAFKNINGDDTLEIKYRNIVQTGTSLTTVEKIEKIDLAGGIMALRLSCPTHTLLADYTAKGKTLGLEFDGQGKANITTQETYTDLTMKFHVEAGHIKLDSVHINFDFGKIYLDFPNLMMKENEESSKSANSYLQENADVMFAGFKPQLEEFYEKIMGKAIQNLFDAVPYSALFKSS